MTPVTVGDLKVPLPPRYRESWRSPFEDHIYARLAADMTVLDVGSGRNPTVPADRRPQGTKYVGLDLSGAELRAAGTGAYDLAVVGDVRHHMPGLVSQVDVAVSWQVFEHVKPLEVALNNIYQYLKPGGSLVSVLSGGWSVFAIVNRLIPSAIGGRLVEHSMRRLGTNQPVFPAYYDRCSERSLRRMMTGWSEVTIHPLFRGATYFHFSNVLTRAYLIYENATRRAKLKNLATHYLLIGQK